MHWRIAIPASGFCYTTSGKIYSREIGWLRCQFVQFASRIASISQSPTFLRPVLRLRPAPLRDLDAGTKRRCAFCVSKAGSYFHLNYECVSRNQSHSAGADDRSACAKASQPRGICASGRPFHALATKKQLLAYGSARDGCISQQRRLRTHRFCCYFCPNTVLEMAHFL